jgi:tRNA/rRNA methyltransferase
VKAPAIILVSPQMGENIGAAARAMANCALTELRLVAPRDGWPNEKAIASASGATAILDGAKLYDTTREAIADLSYVVASTARPRDLVKPVLTPEYVIGELRSRIAGGAGCGILFGAERTGLLNEDIGLADVIITVPLNPDFTSLNLAQAVLLIGHEWFKSGDKTPPRVLGQNGSQAATKEELINLFDHLEEELQAGDYFKNPQMKPTIVANLRAMLQRAEMTQQEVRTFHGMIVALVGRARGKS